jgi:hypothetical protein
LETKAAFVRSWWMVGLCPGCSTPLTDIDCSGDVHRPDGTAWFGGSGDPSGLCPFDSDDLYSLCLIGSGVVRVS